MTTSHFLKNETVIMSLYFPDPLPLSSTVRLVLCSTAELQHNHQVYNVLHVCRVKMGSLNLQFCLSNGTCIIKKGNDGWKRKINNQEVIQSNSTSCPCHQKRSRARLLGLMRVRLVFRRRRFDPAVRQNILSWRLVMKSFLRPFSPYRWFKQSSCQLLAKGCALSTC